jgi:hypothetical protein
VIEKDTVAPSHDAHRFPASLSNEDLQQEGVPITAQTLAQRAGVQWATAQKFLRREHETILFPLGPCQQRLETAYAHLQQEGKPITGYALVQLTDVHEVTALKFLRAHQDGSLVIQPPPQHRVQAAYEHLRQGGTPITAVQLARATQVSEPTARRFLENQPEV